MSDENDDNEHRCERWCDSLGWWRKKYIFVKIEKAKKKFSSYKKNTSTLKYT